MFPTMFMTWEGSQAIGNPKITNANDPKSIDTNTEYIRNHSNT